MFHFCKRRVPGCEHDAAYNCKHCRRSNEVSSAPLPGRPMTRTLTRRPPAKHRAPLLRLPRAPRGRHRSHHPRRRFGYAAAGVLAVTGTVAAGAPVVVGADAAVAPRPVAQAPTAPTSVTPAPAAPRRERASRSTTRRPAYRVVVKTVPGQVLHGRATWYGPGFAGRRTASGEVFDPRQLTAAHRTLPFGTRLNVCLRGRCVVVRINDRGPFGNAILDMSWLAATRIGLIGPGIAPVTATVLETRRVRERV